MKTATVSALPVVPFDFESHEVRIQVVNDQPWFVAMDVAYALGYSDAQAMTRRLDDDEIQNRQIVGLGNRGATLINESGLYSAILRSRKPAAKRFKKWVTSEVLPAIRKHGRYEDCEGKMATLIDQTIGTDGFHILQELIVKKTKVLPVGVQRQAKSKLWSVLHTRFNVPRAEMIPADDMDSACNFVAAYALEGEYLAAIQDDDHITINLPKAPSDQFDNLPADRLYGGDTVYLSKLTELIVNLRQSIDQERYVRVMNIDAALTEVLALRHRLETTISTITGMRTNLTSINSSAERLRERWMTVFNPCIKQLNSVAAREFQERLHMIYMNSKMLRKEVAVVC